MQDRVEAFLHYLSAERGSSKNTIDAYRNDLSGFRTFIDGNGFQDPAIAKAITRNSINAYIADLNSRRYARATVARKVAAVKSFCTFLLDHGDLSVADLEDERHFALGAKARLIGPGPPLEPHLSHRGFQVGDRELVGIGIRV